MAGELPVNTGFDPTTIEGKGGIVVGGAGNVVISGPAGPGGAGGVIQEVFGAFGPRPAELTQLGPGGPYVTLFSVPITTGPFGNALDIQAALTALITVIGSAGLANVAIRVLVDGLASPDALAAAQAGDAGSFVSLAQQFRFAITPPVPPATSVLHTVALQWKILSAVSATMAIANPDDDGATLIVRELT